MRALAVVGKTWERPQFRVVFLTSRRAGIERAYHILALAAETSRNSTRRLVYAATHDCYLTDDPGVPGLHSPIFLDHHGDWQSLVDLHPTVARNEWRGPRSRSAQ